eukprot:CFRG7151T1
MAPSRSIGAMSMEKFASTISMSMHELGSMLFLRKDELSRPCAMNSPDKLLTSVVTKTVRKHNRKWFLTICSVAVVTIITVFLGTGIYLGEDTVGISSQLEDTDFFILALAWIPSLCSTSEYYNATAAVHCVERAPSDRFGVHGLWRSHRTGGQLQSCESRAFAERVFYGASIPLALPETYDYWYSLGHLYDENISPEGFWNYEYSKHGSCSGMSVYEYFHEATGLARKYNPSTVWNDAGFFPDNHNKYKVKTLAKVYKEYFNQEVKIECLRSPLLDSSVITQLLLCFELDFSPTACPDKLFEDRCSGNAFWPEASAL